MPTSAEDRFERLFANTPRPSKPSITELNDRDHQDNHQDNSVSVKADEKDKGRAQEVSCQQGATDALLSSEDDEYTNLFSKKPAMKNFPAKMDSKPAPGPTERVGSTRSEGLGDIEFVPAGKTSAAQRDYNERSKDINDNVTSSYTGNGHPLVGQFCVLSLVAKFPYKYMKDPNDKVSQRFFASNKFYDRQWHLYYLHTSRSADKGALLLLPLTQVQELMNEISSEFKIQLRVPSSPFTLDFYDDGTPQPISLGISMSKQEVQELTANIPVSPQAFGECPPNATTDLHAAYEAFNDKIEKAFVANKSKGKNTAQKKAKKILDSLKESRNQVNRAERYFGLRPQTKPFGPYVGRSWEEEQNHQKSQREACGLLFDFLSVSKPTQHRFEHEPVIISIDIESYERNHGLITEIGVSTLDTLDLVNIPPGLAGEDWIKEIRSRHFRIKGREHLVNKDFCIGHPDAFEFGKSEFVALSEVADAVDCCFEWPFSVQFKCEGSNRSGLDAVKETTSTGTDPTDLQKGLKDRNIVLLGHDIGTDLEYLNQLGSEIFGSHVTSTTTQNSSSQRIDSRHRVLTSILETLDTASLYKTWRQEPQPRNLGSICTLLGMDPWFLHNAGNDARYTLEALVKMLIQARLDEDQAQRERDPSSTGIVQDEWEAEKMRQIDGRVESARRKLEHKIVVQHDSHLAEENPLVQRNEDEGAAIDWSLPLRGERSTTRKEKKNKSAPERAVRDVKEEEISMDEQIRRFHQPQGVTAADPIWPSVQGCQPPRGW